MPPWSSPCHQPLLLALCAVLFIYLPLVLSSPFRCGHGTFISKSQGCECNYNFTGPTCMREMHCGSYERNPDGSCTSCDEHWNGTECDVAICENEGELNRDRQHCKCPEPFSGRYCEQLRTKDVYFHYNHAMSVIGPLGMFTIIPLWLIYYFCEREADKKQDVKKQKLADDYLVAMKREQEEGRFPQSSERQQLLAVR